MLTFVGIDLLAPIRRLSRLDSVRNGSLRRLLLATFATNDCLLYLVPGRMPLLETEADERDLAENIVCRLEYLIKERYCRLIRYFSCTNELSVGNRYGAMIDDLPRFKRIQTELWRAFRRHGFDIRLVATDVSEFSNFGQIKWAAENMDEITAAYCAHNYTTGAHTFGDPAQLTFARMLCATTFPTATVILASRPSRR